MPLDIVALLPGPNGNRMHDPDGPDDATKVADCLRMRKIPATVKELGPGHLHIVAECQSDCSKTIRSILGHVFGEGVEIIVGNGHS